MTINGPAPIFPQINHGIDRATPPPVTPATPPTHAPEAGPGAPDGVNPELWSVLTSDERAFLVQELDIGDLTYGRSRAHSTRPDAPRGQRIDVRV